MARLTDNSSLPALQNAVLRFCTWWRSELTSAFHPLTRLFKPRRAAGITVLLSRGGDGEEASRKALAATMEPDTWEVLARNLTASGRRGPPLVIDLAQDLVLRRKASYPGSAFAKLDDIVALDIEKSTPFSRQSAVWKWHVTSRADGQIEVETVVLRRDLVLTILSFAARYGLIVGEVVFTGTNARHPLRLMKLETPADLSRARWRRLNAALAGVALLLALATAGTAYWQRETALGIATARLADAKSRAIRLRRSQAEAVAQYDASVALMREKIRTPSVNAVWSALSETLPDSVFLSALELSGETGRISGFARSAAPLIEKLEGLDELSGVTFASPVMINPDDRLERFDVTFTIAPTGKAGQAAAPAGTNSGQEDAQHE
ncbi:fimbrial assembly protein PilN [Breoghania corrubedonensis]|uniref:Fimbrial assembly protein PilN n=1 Tax=Breoghania corrubedonensis TaxID=665038 RepID=A0A2T5VBC2_9HYPH|nr:PilN domain-containing protein [Breoghania corrubedonensis]PTW61056.1 fimbrial assembly protein PilN [Breoghania corrubedonensis]